MNVHIREFMSLSHLSIVQAGSCIKMCITAVWGFLEDQIICLIDAIYTVTKDVCIINSL